MNRTSSTLAAITDVAICAQTPHPILVATEQGHVHLFSDVEAPSGAVWICHGGALRVGWAGTQPIAWNTDPASSQLFVLGADGQVWKQHAIPPHCDLAPSNDGFFVATDLVRLAHHELARDGSYSREVRNISAPGRYDPGSLTASATGAVALRSGGLVQVQTKPSRAWQDVKAGGVAPALSTRGTRLATAWPHADGSHVQSFTIDDSEVVLETPYAVRALPNVITHLDWSLDESMLVAYARDEGDVRVFSREGWVPGLWTTSAIRPRFHPSGVVTVPKSRDRLMLHDPRGVVARTWSRWRSTTPETFSVGGAGSMRRGDKIVVFEREPRMHPTSIYEVVEAHRKDDDTRGLPEPPALCRIRLGLASIPDRLLDADASALSAIERSKTGELDLATARSLLERLLVDQPDALEHMRIHLATSSTIQTPQPAARAPSSDVEAAESTFQSRNAPELMEHVEAIDPVKPADSSTGITNGESPARIGAFEPIAVPPTVPSPRAFDSMIGDGVDVLLVTAVEVERDAVLPHLQPLDGCIGVIRAPIKDHVYFLGRLGSTVAALVMTRMGASMRDGSTLAVNEAIGVCRPRAVIAVGIAWGMSTKLRLADVLVSTQIVAFDVVRRQAEGDIYRAAKPEAGGLLLNRFRNITGWTFARGDGRKPVVKDGPMLSGESLIDDLEFKTKLYKAFPDTIGGEMEGTGIYGASAKHRGEWIIVKAICDWADGTKDKRAQPVAAAAAAALVAHVVSEPTTLDGLPRMKGWSEPPGAGSRGEAAASGDTTASEGSDAKAQPPGEPWRLEKRATKRAEVAAEVLVAALAILDGLISVVSIFVMRDRDLDPSDPRGTAAWRDEVGHRWATFAPISNRFVDAIRLAETYLPDEVNELINRVWMERASIKAAHSTYFQTPEATEFFSEGFGSQPEKRLLALRDECRRVLRPIVQLA